MIINIITDTRYNSGLMREVEILIKLFQRAFKNRVKTRLIPHFKYSAPYADINIFLETLTNQLIQYARFNILIPDQELFYKTWTPYLSNIDLVLTKTLYATNIFKNLIITSSPSSSPLILKYKTVFLGMTSIDKYNSDIDKNFNKWLHLAGGSPYKNTQTIIDIWELEYPNLTIVYDPNRLSNLNIKTQANITYISQFIPDNELKNLMNEYGVHLCCSSVEGYGHYINEARSTGAIVITTDGEPMRQFVDNEVSGFLISTKSRKSVKDGLGSYYILDVEDFRKTILLV